MPELRKDPIIGRWVIIATERFKRPSDFVSEPAEPSPGFCPFDEGNEDRTPPEIVAYRNPDTAPNTPGWTLRVVPNKFPALEVEGVLGKRGVGIYDQMNGIGAHEVIIETPKHETTLTALSLPHIRDVLWVYRERLIDLDQDNRLNYGMVFKNVGRVAGASLEHTHSQIIVLPITPRTVAAEMHGGKVFHDYRGRCIFCDMVLQEQDSGSRVVYDGDGFLAIEPYAARFPFETWILPKEHSSRYQDITTGGAEGLARCLRTVLLKLEVLLNMPPYNYIIHTTPFDLGPVPHYHWHIEIIPRLTKVAGFEWGTGFYINPLPPETAAEHLRQTNVET
ncbi:MAG: galactose-1-phosphate uridylyltransferase [Candidatus Brocadiae bacterium]|nr:galactose-1-phosphate uridylyltransferase [Candidatus Brocadiia bacterium]